MNAKPILAMVIFIRELIKLRIAAETKVLKPCGRALIKLDFSMSIPEGCYGRIGGHSGSANMCGIIVHGGTIDSDHRGVLCVVLFNHSDGEYTVEAGNHIAQLIT